MYASPDATDRLTAGLAHIRTEFSLPGAFPSAVEAEAASVAATPISVEGRRDLRTDRFVTLDPATSTDLDQAFDLALEGDTYVLRYAIADVAAAVRSGGAIEAEAWRRGSTLYLPDQKIAQYPQVLSEGAASLLPNVDRAAVLITVRLGPELVPELASIERVVIQSKAKLAYETCSPVEAHPLLEAFAQRMEESDRARGAERVQRPEQEIEHDVDAPGEIRLEFRALTPSEQANSAMSLAANMAIAGLFRSRGMGLFRDLDDPSRRDVAMLRRTARALGLPWHDHESLRDVLRRLRPDNPVDATFSIAVRRSGGGAQYRWYESSTAAGELRAEDKVGKPDGPWHAAMGAPYAHATAPLRRLADRYVLELALALYESSDESSDVASNEASTLVDALQRLPKVMGDVASLSGKVERACIDLVEAIVLSGREGQAFTGVVAEDSGPTAVVHLVDEGIRIRLPLPDAVPGDVVQLRLRAADPAKRLLAFDVVKPKSATDL